MKIGNESQFWNRTVLFFFFLFLAAPYLLLVFQISLVTVTDPAELWWALKNSLWQSLGSSLGTLLLGLILVRGLWTIPVRYQKFFEILLILPGVLPPLFVLLTVMTVLQPFPIGVAGVILLHTLMNAGLVALFFQGLFENKLHSLSEVAAVEGASAGKFFWAVGGMVRRDLLAIFAFIFALSFCSFSVPLIAGGGKATTLEILIYEKIRISGAWGEALTLALVQLAVMFLFSLVRLKGREKRGGRFEGVAFLKNRGALVILFFYTVGFILSFIVESFQGWFHVFNIPGLWEEALNLVPMTLGFSLACSLTIFLLLLLAAHDPGDEKLRRWISGFVSPSTALVGFSLLFWTSSEEPWLPIKWILGFSYLVFATLYRWGWDQELSGLQSQVQVARTMGASGSMIFQKVIFPQVLPTACRLSAVAGLWALGDFSLGKIIVAQDMTLAMLIETLLSSYRLDAAMALLSGLLVLGLVPFLFFKGIEYVCRRTAS